MRLRKEVNIGNSDEVVFMARIGAVLSHPVRIALYRYVKSKNVVRNDVCNKDLVMHFDYSQSSLSQHVKKLVDSGLVKVEYKDRFSFYQVNEKLMQEYIQLLNQI